MSFSTKLNFVLSLWNKWNVPTVTIASMPMVRWNFVMSWAIGNICQVLACNIRFLDTVNGSHASFFMEKSRGKLNFVVTLRNIWNATTETSVDLPMVHLNFENIRNTRQSLAKNISDDGYCNYGSRCTFLHEEIQEKKEVLCNRFPHLSKLSLKV